MGSTLPTARPSSENAHSAKEARRAGGFERESKAQGVGARERAAFRNVQEGVAACFQVPWWNKISVGGPLLLSESANLGSASADYSPNYSSCHLFEV